MQQENFREQSPSNFTRVCETLNLDTDTTKLAQEFLSQIWDISELQVGPAQKDYKTKGNCLVGAICFIAAKASTFKTVHGEDNHGIGVGIYQAIKSSFDTKP